jgi:hypothetical protein
LRSTAPAGRENPEGDPVGPLGKGRLGVALHDGKFGATVTKSRRPRTNHGDDRQPHRGAGFPQGAQRRGESAQHQGAIEFDAIRAAAFGLDAVFHRCGANFQFLDAAREQIAPSLGAVTYTIGPNQIQSMGQGENSSFQQVLLQAPGVVQEEFGEIHVRGDHGDVQYRVNGVLLPESLNGFGQEIDTHLIQSVTLITGTMPAQFGDRTAGIIDVTTKTGFNSTALMLSLYGGSYDTFNPSLQWGGTTSNLDYFVAASYLHDNHGIDNTTASPNPLHDVTDQEKLFGYFSHPFDQTSRLTLLLSSSDAGFQIPDTAGVAPIYQLANSPTADSAAANNYQTSRIITRCSPIRNPRATFCRKFPF